MKHRRAPILRSLGLVLLLAGVTPPALGQINFEFTAVDSTIICDPATGIGSGPASVTNFDASATGFPNAVQGWQVDLSHDENLVSVAAIEQGPHIAVLNGRDTVPISGTWPCSPTGS